MQSALARGRRARLAFACLVAVTLAGAAAAARADDAGPDLDAIRADIAANGWTFEVSDDFSRSLTPEQRRNLRGFTPPPGYEEELRKHLRIYPVTDKALPTNLDWRDLGGVTPVKNQAECGSCWAFAATAELESFVKIYTGIETDLSEQQVISCNPYGADCGGGWATAAYFVFQNGGAVLENCAPYRAANASVVPCMQDGMLRYGWTTGYDYIANDVEQIKAALQNGPVCTGIDASAEFENYSSGCYNVPGYTINHLVLIVGYDDRACNGNGAWLIKNSWGSSFGESGYIWVQYGAGLTGHSVTQLRYTPPPVSVTIDPTLGGEPLRSEQTHELTWTTSGEAVSTVDIRLGIDGDCHDIVVAENVPNTGSYSWLVPNLGNRYASVLIYPSEGTQRGYGKTPANLHIIGHKVRYVSALGSDTPPYETPATAAHGIAAAITACTGEDTVLVAGGDYLVSASVSGPIHLIGGWADDFSARDPAAWPTRVDTPGSALRFLASAGDFCGVEGFTFYDCIGGYFAQPVGGQHGGGVYSVGASPTIRDCVFESNRAAPGANTGYGGAACFVGGNPLIEDCTFSGNLASQGGALAFFAGASATLNGNVFTGNACTDSSAQNLGAALRVDASSVVVTGGAFTDNGSSGGGGAAAATGSSLTLDGVAVTGNRTLGGGGGVSAADGTLVVRNSVFAANTNGGGNGGGIAASNVQLEICNARITGNRAGNMGGGIVAFSANGVLENTVVDGNVGASAGGVAAVADGGLTVRNNVVAGNTGGGLLVAGAGLVSDYNNVWNNAGGDYLAVGPGAHDLAVDPLFAPGGSCLLLSGSPCVDRGDPDPSCADPDGSRADIGRHGGPGAEVAAPPAVTGAALTELAGGQVRITWDASPAPDLAWYRVYRDTTEQFMPTEANTVDLVPAGVELFEDTPPTSGTYYLVAAIDSDGLTGGYSAPVSVGGLSPVEGDDLPQVLAIAGVIPNPFNPRAEIRFDVPAAGRVELAVYDVRGRLVRQLVATRLPAGRHSETWDGRDDGGRAVAAGVYFARVRAGRTAVTSKMVLAK